MKEIGQKLREAREKRNLSIQDVSNATKINIKTVEAIESGDVESLPAKPFLRGFVQTYAKYLDLNADDIMKQFLEIQGSTKPKPLTIEELEQTQQPNHEDVQKRVELYKKLAYTITALLAVILIYTIHKVVSRYENESKKARENKDAVISQVGAPVENSTPSTPIPGALPVDEKKSEEAKADDDKKVEDVKKSEETVKEDDIKKIEADAKKKADEETKKAEADAKKKADEEAKKLEAAKKKADDEAKKAEAAAAAAADAKKKSDEEAKKEEPKPKKEKSQEVIIEALDNVEVTYVKDNGDEQKVHLKPEQVLTIKALSKVSLDVKDGGAVNISHNGHDKGVPGSLGQSIHLTYP
jgi:cytoskeleton protein RodZ